MKKLWDMCGACEEFKKRTNYKNRNWIEEWGEGKSEQLLKEKTTKELKGKINEGMCNFIEEFIKIGKEIKERGEEAQAESNETEEMPNVTWWEINVYSEEENQRD